MERKRNNRLKSQPDRHILRGYSHLLHVQYLKIEHDSFRLRNFKLMIHYRPNILRSITYATEKRRKIPPKSENSTPLPSPDVSKKLSTCLESTIPGPTALSCTGIHSVPFISGLSCQKPYFISPPRTSVRSTWPFPLFLSPFHVCKETISFSQLRTSAGLMSRACRVCYK